jgi:hypothetical protein
MEKDDDLRQKIAVHPSVSIFFLDRCLLLFSLSYVNLRNIKNAWDHAPVVMIKYVHTSVSSPTYPFEI